jgi:hypothetical protein
MDAAFKPTDQVAFLALLNANKSQLCAYGLRDGWHLVVRHGKVSKALAAEDGGLWIFRTLEGVNDYLRGRRMSYFTVDISGLDKTAGDPATVERLSEAQKATEYDAWFRQQVQESLDDPSPTIPDSVVEEKFAARRAEILKKLAKV